MSISDSPTRLRALVVDDEAPIRHALRREFSRIGLEVLTCTGPAEALALSSETVAGMAVLILDYYMPGMDGLQLAGRLRQQGRPGKPLRVLILSAGALDEDERVTEALRAGLIDGVLSKPWDRQKLLETVRALAGLPLS